MTRVYCGNLPLDIKERELEDLFRKYGRIRDISIKSGSRPPAFAFLSFEDHRDARDAIRGRDGYEFDGARLRVELANERARSRVGGGGGGGGGSGGGRRTEYRVIITGLSSSVSWQDLKDLGRSVGDVVHADVSRSSGEGVLEFSSKHDMFRATKKLDSTDFRGGPIRVRLPSDSRFRSSSRSRSPRARSRSRSRSRSARRSSRSPPKRSRSPSPGDRSPDRKRSQSPDQREHSAERNGKREDGGRSRDDDEEQNGGGVKHERDREEERSRMEVETN